MDDIPNEVRKVAATLAKQDRRTLNVEVFPGFTVASWLLYVSRAEELIRDHAAVIDAGGK